MRRKKELIDKTKREKRRRIKEHKKMRLMRIMTYGGYVTGPGWTEWGYMNGIYQPIGKYVHPRKNSRRQGYWKNYSNRKIRRAEHVFQKGNQHRKLYDYRWEID